jgi:HEPN domain-containing protein
MSVELRRKAELFYIVSEEIHAAEQLWRVSPNIAVWLCTQAAEKTMKGYLFCINKEYGYDHNLEVLLDATNKQVKLPDNTNKAILYLDEYKGRLRYRRMSTDPTPEDARIAISKAKEILDEFGRIPDIASYVNEAKELHANILKSIAD